LAYGSSSILKTSHIASVWPFFHSRISIWVSRKGIGSPFMDLCDYIGYTLIIQDKIVISRTLIRPANPLCI
jgi:hypothetical protein